MAKDPKKRATKGAKPSAQKGAGKPVDKPTGKRAEKSKGKPDKAKPGGKTTVAKRTRKLVEKLAKRHEKLVELTAEIADLEVQMGKAPGVSPLAPKTYPKIPEVAGLRLSTAAAGVKYKGRDDVLLAEMAAGTVLAGSFTRSETRAAPVLWCQDRLAELAKSPGRRKLGLIVNSGNANAFTGDNGVAAVAEIAGATAKALGTAKGRVLMASTGVIGEPLPSDRITAVLTDLTEKLAPAGFDAAARAIMTTDTYPKGVGRVVELDGVPVAISGIVKGSGMIAPDMATMLGFIFTDCAIAQPLLQATLSRLVGASFNAITVDSDTSTSDTVLLAATGKAPMPPILSRRDRRFANFEAALAQVMQDLALLVVRDGEGATKLVEISVTGAKTHRAAHRIAMAIANSPLVKTAIAGEDPNWGRIVMAVGKAGEAADRDRLAIRFGEIQVAEAGWVSPGYREEDGAAYMRRDEIEISVDVGIGQGEAKVWTCDLTKRYIEINADYRS